MRRLWEALLCRLDVHSWETAEVNGDKGWKCTRCSELVLEREYLERVHDSDATNGPAMSGGAVAAPPFM